MRKEYDFSNSAKNSYIKKLKKQITIRLENETIEYFKKLAIETDIPYQKLINLLYERKDLGRLLYFSALAKVVKPYRCILVL